MAIPEKCKLWGEFETLTGSAPTDNVPDITADIARDIENAMNPECLSDYDTDYDNIELKNEYLTLPSMNPLMLYAIELHKHANNMTDMINTAKDVIASNVTPAANASIPLPEMPDVKIKHKKYSLNYLNKDSTPFTEGQEINVPEISHSLAKEIIIKCVATMFAHVGFENSHQSVLDILSDVLEAFLVKISYNLKIAHEDKKDGNLNSFPSIEERVLLEMGMGGVKGLHDYYVNRVVKYINVLRKRSEELIGEYERLSTPSEFTQEDTSNKVFRIKQEVDDDVTHVVHFPDNVEASETNLQLLNAFEAEHR